MNKQRPVNLDLGTMKFPPMAIASIFHRVSGIVLFVLLPYMMYLLSHSLGSANGFQHVQTMLANPLNKLIVWGFIAAVIYHLFAGIRHILMDMGIGEHLEAGRRSALILMVLAGLAIIMVGIWLW